MNGRNGFASRFISNQSKQKHITLNKDNAFQIAPFKLIAGFISSTENGIVSNDNSYIDDYSTFQRIFTGLENILAVWEDSIIVQKMNENDNFLTKIPNFAGRSFWGMVTNESTGAVFEPSPIDASFLEQFTTNSFSVFTYENLSEDDLFKLYTIPGINETKWLYITSATKFYNTKKEFEHVEITFTTLNETIARSGGAVEQFVHRSAPGEGYAWPRVNDNGILETDPIFLRDRPITSMQEEFSGPAGINTLFAYGRPVEQNNNNGIITNKFNEKVQAPRLLLPYLLETPIPSPLNTKPTAEANWYTGLFTPTLWDNYDTWKKQFESSFNMSMRNAYEGVLSFTKNDIKNSNPTTDGTYAHILWDSTWKPKTTRKYDCRTNAMSIDELDLNGDYTIPQMFAHNIFGTSYLEALPLQITQNITWRLSDIPIIGGFLSKLTFGIPIGWNDNSIRLKAENVWLMLPSSVVEYGEILMGGKDSGMTPLDIFAGQAQTENVINSGINTTGSIIKVSLTDLFKITKGTNEYLFSTLHLGQTIPTHDENNKLVNASDFPTTKLLWDETCVPQLRKAAGYVIDTATSKALAKMTYRRTFFAMNYQDWTGTYKTQSSFTGSIRDWNNTIKMSKWESVSATPVHYPQVIVDPNPPSTNYPDLNFNPLANFNIYPKEFVNEMLKNDCVNVYTPVNMPRDPNLTSKQTFNTFFDAQFNVEQGSSAAGKGAHFGQKFTFKQPTIVSNEFNDKLLYSFDTTSHGGMVVFLQNYKKLHMSYEISTLQENSLYNFKDNSISEDLISQVIDLQQLSITNEMVIINEVKDAEQYYKFGANDSQSCTITPLGMDDCNFYLEIRTKTQIILRIDNNKINVIARIEYSDANPKNYVINSLSQYWTIWLNYKRRFEAHTNYYLSITSKRNWIFSTK